MDTVRMSAMTKALRDFRQQLAFLQARDRYHGKRLRNYIELEDYSDWAREYEDELTATVREVQNMLARPMQGLCRW